MRYVRIELIMTITTILKACMKTLRNDFLLVENIAIFQKILKHTDREEFQTQKAAKH